MNKNLVRTISLLLIPCLLLTTVSELAVSSQQGFHPAYGSRLTAHSPFAEQAFQLPAVVSRSLKLHSSKLTQWWRAFAASTNDHGSGTVLAGSVGGRRPKRSIRPASPAAPAYPSQHLGENWAAQNPVSAYFTGTALLKQRETALSDLYVTAIAENGMPAIREAVKKTFPGMVSLTHLKMFKSGLYQGIGAITALFGKKQPSVSLALVIGRHTDPDMIRAARNDAANLAYYWKIKRRRYIPRPYASMDFNWALLGRSGVLPAMINQRFEGYDELNFTLGGLRQWMVSPSRQQTFRTFDPAQTAAVMKEIIACVAYHYEPAVDGGTTISGVNISAGDFIYKERKDGSPDVRLITIRDRRNHVSPTQLIRALIQFPAMLTQPDSAEMLQPGGVPGLASNPPIAFYGLVLGLRNLYQDLENNPEKGEQVARRWIADFKNTDEGRPYAVWVDLFLKGQLPLTFGDDPVDGKPTVSDIERVIGDIRMRRDAVFMRTGTAPANMAEIDQLIRSLESLAQEIADRLRPPPAEGDHHAVDAAA